jgi:methionyl aminopeptidase
VIEEDLAARQEAHAPPRSREERGAELVFERADLAAERRLRDVQPRRGAADVLLFCDGDEVADLGEAHALQLNRSKRYWTAPAAPFIVSRMAVEIYAGREIDALRRAGRAAAATLVHVGERLRAGIATAQIDRWVREHTAVLGGKPSQLGYKGFPAAVCTSKNEVVCHGIPSERVRLRDGDIVNVDVTTDLDGFHGDTSATFLVGEVSAEARHVVEVARRCRDAGVAVVRDGARLGDVGAAIEELARAEGCTVVREFGGHGIGRKMHMPPHVSHVGTRGAGMRLRAGMVFTIEPMVNLGRADVRVLDDGWTVVTEDGSLSAQFEHTVLVTKNGAEVLTR